MYILLSIGISKIQFACYTQLYLFRHPPSVHCLFGFQRYNLHAIHNRGVDLLCAGLIVYLDFKDTICMLYTTQLLVFLRRALLSIWISKIQFACYTQHQLLRTSSGSHCLFGFQRYNLHAIHN